MHGAIARLPSYCSRKAGQLNSFLTIGSIRSRLSFEIGPETSCKRCLKPSSKRRWHAPAMSGERGLRSDGSTGPSVTGHRHGRRSRSLLGTFGQVTIAVPRARLNTPDGATTEWKSRRAAGLPAPYSRRRRTDRQLLTSPAPTRVGCGAHLPACSAER